MEQSQQEIIKLAQKVILKEIAWHKAQKSDDEEREKCHYSFIQGMEHALSLVRAVGISGISKTKV